MGKRGKQRKLQKERLLAGDDEVDTDARDEMCSDEAGCRDDEDTGGKYVAQVLLGGISKADLETTIQTIQNLADDLVLFRSRPFKRLRGALAPLAQALLGDAPADRKRRRGKGGWREGSTNLEGLDPEARLKQMDREAMNQRVLRAERLARLALLNAEGAPDTFTSEGCGKQLLLSASASCSASLVEKASHDAALLKPTCTSRVPDGPALGSSLDDVPPATLHFARACYICKAAYRDLHRFYAALCPSCAELNWRKRDERADLSGRVALVTGG